MNHIAQLSALREATLGARVRTGRRDLGTRVEKGKVQIVEVTVVSDDGGTEVKPLSESLTYDECVARLNAMDDTP